MEMAIISKRKTTEKEKIKLDINKDIYIDIRKYCSWAEIEIDYFFEESAQYIFSKDKKWKEHNRSASSEETKESSEL